MIWENITSNLGSAAVAKNHGEFLVFGFAPATPLAPFTFDSGWICEPGWTGGKVRLVKYSVPYRMPMGGSTKLVFDAASTSVDGVAVLMKPSERVVTNWNGTAGSPIQYDLPINSILLRNTSGYLVKAAVSPNPRTCKKIFCCNRKRQVYYAGASGTNNTGAVADFDAAGFTTLAMSAGIPRTLLEQRGFLDSEQQVAFRMAYLPCGIGRANVWGVHPNAVSINTSPANTLNFQFSTPATKDCRLIVEYSGPNGWKPLAIMDTTQGFTRNGRLHFEPPADWTATSRWDEQADVGGGAPGSGPKARWIRIQRRLMTGAGAISGGVTAENLPYVVATRKDNKLVLPITEANVGQKVAFRFVPISDDGQENREATLTFIHTIAGKAFV